MRGTDLTSRDLATTDLLNREWAPCRHACPVHADVRAYLEAIAQGRWRDAIDVIRENLPMASVCGRICHHPCEANCRRADVDQAVAIRELKRFVAELQGAEGSTVHRAPAQDKARVAVVGGGPSGLTAALELAKLGYRPTIYEKFSVAGGIPATAVPKYRLPRDVVRIDVDWILAHGIDLKVGFEVGKDLSIDDLRREGFAAVVVATGLPKSRLLPIPGADHARVLPALEFLTAVAFDRPADVGRDVLVIGGGNVAVDAARSAVRCGAERVRMMCLESTDEMPAYAWEQREAAEEGVEVIHRRGPTEVILKNGQIVGVKTRAVRRVFDEKKRFSPEYDDADTMTLDCDTVILAIGQGPDFGFTAGSPLKADPRGRLAWRPETCQTDADGIFACGEIVTPPGSVVEACASGRRAARAVDQYLRGEPIRIDDALPPPIDKIAPTTAEKIPEVPREPVAEEPPELRRRAFSPVDRTYAEATALREARRCMSCGSGAEVLVDKCSACLTCLRVCPFDIPKVTDVARIDSTLCQACGICIAECPADAIIARGWDARDLPDRAAEALAATKGAEVVALITGHRAGAAEWRGEAEPVAGVAEIYLPSIARISTQALLQTLERGARSVLVVACQGPDRFPEATERLRRRVTQARDLVAEIGLAPDCIQLLEVADQGRPAVRDALTQAAQKAATDAK